MGKEQYEVEDVGIIGTENGLWLFCENLDAVNALKPGETARVDFKSGAGKDTLRVTRLHDKE